MTKLSEMIEKMAEGWADRFNYETIPENLEYFRTLRKDKFIKIMKSEQAKEILRYVAEESVKNHLWSRDKYDMERIHFNAKWFNKFIGENDDTKNR